MADTQRTHLTWSIEMPRGECPECGGKTVLISAGHCWEADEEATDEAFGKGAYEKKFSDGFRFSDGVTIREDITGHYCRECDRLTSLALNT